jgi:hypothetical protein
MATEIWGGFKKHFNLERIFIYESLTNASGKYQFDIFEFEEWLITQGYQADKEGSIADFITDKYGKEATSFIESLL